MGGIGAAAVCSNGVGEHFNFGILLIIEKIFSVCFF